MYGSDQAASLELSGFRNMINSINKIHLAFGEEKIGHITDEEKKNIKKIKTTYQLILFQKFQTFLKFF